MRKKRDDKLLSEEEIARRRDAALKRALSTPPKTHKEMVKKSKSTKGR